MKSYTFRATFRARINGEQATVTHCSKRKIQGKFLDFLQGQQDSRKRIAFLDELTNSTFKEMEPVSLEIDLGSVPVPVYHI